MQLLIELLLWFIIEIVFWGIMFWTGYAVIFALSLGRWKLPTKATKQNQRRELKFIIVASIGFVLWLGIAACFIIYL